MPGAEGWQGLRPRETQLEGLPDRGQRGDAPRIPGRDTAQTSPERPKQEVPAAGTIPVQTGSKIFKGKLRKYFFQKHKGF